MEDEKNAGAEDSVFQSLEKDFQEVELPRELVIDSANYAITDLSMLGKLMFIFRYSQN